MSIVTKFLIMNLISQTNIVWSDRNHYLEIHHSFHLQKYTYSNTFAKRLKKKCHRQPVNILWFLIYLEISTY